MIACMDAHLLDTKAALQLYLQEARDAILWKLEGLGERDLRLPRTPTGTNLLGIVRHVANVEIDYFGPTFGREWPHPDHPLRVGDEAADADPQADWWVPTDVSGHRGRGLLPGGRGRSATPPSPTSRSTRAAPSLVARGPPRRLAGPGHRARHLRHHPARRSRRHPPRGHRRATGLLTASTNLPDLDWSAYTTQADDARRAVPADLSAPAHTPHVTEMSDDPQPTSRAHTAYAVNAGVAWLGVVLTVVISALGGYEQLPVEAGLYGDTADGAAGSLARVMDTLSYFTIWSNVVVAVSVTLLLARPLRDTRARRVLRLSGLLMITVTAIVYQVLLAPAAVVVGWSRLTDPVLHVVTPILTVVVWAVWGPRGWVTRREVPLALVIPLAWIGWMLARGAVVRRLPLRLRQRRRPRLRLGRHHAGPHPRLRPRRGRRLLGDRAAAPAAPGPTGLVSPPPSASSYDTGCRREHT